MRNHRASSGKIDVQPGPIGTLAPFHDKRAVVGVADLKFARECGMCIAETDQIQKRTHHRSFEPLLQFGARIVMTIDVTAHTGAPQQIHVVRPRQKPDVIDLGHSRSKELNGAGDQVIIVPAAESIVKGAIHLIQIQVACGRSSGLPAFAVAPLVNRFHQAGRFPSGGSNPGGPSGLFRSGPTSITPIPSCVSSTVMALRGLISSQRFRWRALRV